MATPDTNPFGSWLQTPDQPAPTPASSGDDSSTTPAGDVAGVVGSRLLGGAEDIPGAVGDWRDLAGKAGRVAGSTARGLLGKDPLTPEQEAQKEAVWRGAMAGPIDRLVDNLPNSDDIKRWLGYTPYQPQTDAGKWTDEHAGNLIEAAPSVVAGGGAGVLRKAAEEGLGAATKTAGKQLLRYDVAPQEITSNVVDPLGQAVGLNPEAQQVLDAFSQAGIAGVAGLGEHPNYAKVPTAEDIQTAANTKFDNLRKSGFSLPRSSLQDLIGELENAYTQRGVFNERRQPQTWNLMQDLKEAAGRRGPIDFNEIDDLHQQAGDALNSPSKNDRATAGMAYRAIDNWLDRPTEDFESDTPAAGGPQQPISSKDFAKALEAAGGDLSKLDPKQFGGSGPTPTPDQLRGDPQGMVQEWRQARSLSKLSRKVDAVQSAISSVGDVREGGINPAKVLQNNFSKLLTNPKVSRLFTPEEQDAIRDVVHYRGGTVQALMDRLSHWGGVIGLALTHYHGLAGLAEGAGLSGLAGLGGRGASHAAENVAANVRSEYNPSTGGVQPMQKIPLRPGLRPALVVGGLYGARANATPPAQQQSGQMENPFGSWFPGAAP